MNPYSYENDTKRATTFSVGKTVGTGQPVFIIAEIGYNFTTLDEAKLSIDAAKECGADAVKFQTFTAKNLVIKNIDFPKEAGGGNQYQEFQHYELRKSIIKNFFPMQGKKR